MITYFLPVYTHPVDYYFFNLFFESGNCLTPINTQEYIPKSPTYKNNSCLSQTMSCAVAGSPVFSPSRESRFCKMLSPSPEALTLIGSSSASSPSAAAASSSSSLLSPSSPFRLLLQKQVVSGGTRVSKKELFVVDSDPPIFRRKRPASLKLPPPSFTFPIEMLPVGPSEVEVDEERFSVFCKKGKRKSMEDRHAAAVDLDGNSKQAFFGIFDGHGGTRAAEFAAENIGKNVMKEVMKQGEHKMQDAVRSGYLTTDLEFLKEDADGGTCCVTTLIRNGDLVVSNVGDCRAVISRGGVAEALTIDHRPSREDERDRIERLGGYVDNRHGVWRVEGILAVSRGIGDSYLKKWVIAEPDTKVLRISPDCEFLILASDGLWDKVSNQEAVDKVRALCIGTEGKTLSACKELVDLALMRGSADDISAMIIQLGHFI